jgi:D-3-phosphoglycerate dehydrogenase
MKPSAVYFEILKYRSANLELIERYFELAVFPTPREASEEALGRAELVFAPLGFRFDKPFFGRCPRLRAIASNTTGVPHIDLAAAAERGLAVCALHDEQQFLETITPTAEHTIGLMIAAHRRLPAAHRTTVEDGCWDRRPWGAPKMLSRMRLGIVGYGRLGRRVGRIAQAMGMPVRYYDPHVPGGVPDLVELASGSDVLTLHAPANAETRNLVGRKVLQALPRNAIVVNTARGELLDTEVLLKLLASGHLWAAALDTIEGEYGEDFQASFGASALARYARAHDNLILTPHIGGSTEDAWFETERRVIEKACRVFGVHV